ncbi:MAG: hypothetical protein K8I60_12995 [Anaerolineae bacterium]|nr:hypothetical protein [Anaerolineae bacterium]
MEADDDVINQWENTIEKQEQNSRRKPDPGVVKGKEAAFWARGCPPDRLYRNTLSLGHKKSPNEQEATVPKKTAVPITTLISQTCSAFTYVQNLLRSEADVKDSRKLLIQNSATSLDLPAGSRKKGGGHMADGGLIFAHDRAHHFRFEFRTGAVSHSVFHPLISRYFAVRFLGHIIPTTQGYTSNSIPLVRPKTSGS